MLTVYVESLYFHFYLIIDNTLLNSWKDKDNYATINNEIISSSSSPIQSFYGYHRNYGYQANNH